jgi:AraC-like DNA-binding protein
MPIYRPPPPLASLVDFLWESRSYVQPHRAERVLPTGAMDLVIDLTADGGQCGTLSGARSAFFLLDTSRPREFIGARFTIGGGFAFFGPAGALRDRRVPLEILWGRAALELQERLAGAAPGPPRFTVLERFLLYHLDRERRPHPAVRHALLRLRRSGGSTSIGALADACGLSRRYFIEVFRDQVGLTPKLYGRLRRFRRSLAALGDVQEIDWADLAIACGYSDQPHFIHDFRAFTGLTPSIYLRNRTASVNHVRDPG